MDVKGILAVIVAAVLCVSGNLLAYSGGDGTAENPYQIADVNNFQQLSATSTDWAKSFILTADINLASLTFTQAPIAPGSGTRFTGAFDGKGHIISNLTITASGQSYVGLFGYVGSGGNIRNLATENVLVSGQQYASGFVGNNTGSLTSCYSTGSVNGSSYAGGLVGYNQRSLTSCYSTCSVSCSSYGGGLVGYNPNGTLKYCYSTGSVSGSSSGGLLGQSSCGVTACFWDAQTSGRSVGVGSGISTGVVGKTTAEMMTISTFANAGWYIADMNGLEADWIIPSNGQSYPQLIQFLYRDPSAIIPLVGDGTEQTPYQIGSPADLVNLSQYCSVWDKYIILTADLDMDGFFIRPIGNSVVRFTGNFNGQDFVIRNLTINLPNKENVGLFGVIGNGGTITNLGIENVNIAGTRHVGGLIGYNSKGIISSCHSTGQVDGNSLSDIGGLIGFNFGGAVSNCYSNVSISGAGATIGGLVGSNFGTSTISNCYASGVIADTDANEFNSCLGGLVGNNSSSTITNCSATGNVFASSASSARIWIGGLVGNVNHSTISNSYATGMIHAISDSSSTVICGGGLFGLKNNTNVNSCYSTGKVICYTSFDSEPNNYVGGMIGLIFEGAVNQCYSKSAVITNEPGLCVGGFAGLNMDGMINGCFWDISTSGETESAGGIGLTTGQMKTMSIYQNAGWTDKGWVIDDGLNYPHLAWEGVSGIAIPVASPIELSGSGTEEDPYQIWNTQDFAIWNQYASVLDKYTILMDDLDLHGASLDPIGQYGIFTGKFDGNDHIIKNITITQPNNSYVGLFGIVGTGGVVTNLGIEAVNIVGGDYVGGLIGMNAGGTVNACYSTGSVIGANYVGRLIGTNDGGTITDCYSTGTTGGTGDSIGGLIGSSKSGTVSNCYSDGTVTFLWDSNDLSSRVVGDYIGGLIGYNEGGAISNCHSTGDIGGGGDYVGGLLGGNLGGAVSKCYSTGTVIVVWDANNRYNGAGGLVGYNYGGGVTNCYATGSVSGYAYVGGLVGQNASGTLTACYSTGLVSAGYTSVGGMVGYSSGGTITACFWDTTTSGKTASSGGTGKSTAEMMTLATFTDANWDFSTIDGDPADWVMQRPGEDYPRLAWQMVITGDIAGLYGVNFVDFAKLSAYWGQTGCPTGCENADINNDGTVDIGDLMLLADNWLVF